MKTLEEKISGLPPDVRDQVEEFVDFLIEKSGRKHAELTETPPAISKPEADFADTSKSSSESDNLSGVIWADEQVPEKKKFEEIDFADINTRLGKKQESPGLEKKTEYLDWL